MPDEQDVETAYVAHIHGAKWTGRSLQSLRDTKAALIATIRADERQAAEARIDEYNAIIDELRARLDAETTA